MQAHRALTSDCISGRPKTRQARSVVHLDVKYLDYSALTRIRHESDPVNGSKGMHGRDASRFGRVTRAGISATPALVLRLL